MSVVINNEVWAFAPPNLKPSTRFVLVRLSDSALTVSRMTCLGVDRIVRETGVSRSSVFRALRELHDLGVLQNVDHAAIPEAYKVFPTITRRITEPERWTGQPVADFVGEVVLPELLPETEDVPVTPPADQANDELDQQGGVTVTPYTRTSLEERRTSSFSAAPSARRMTPTRAEARRKAAEDDADLDPAKYLFADEQESPARVSGRREPGRDTGMGLARYFTEKVAKLGAWGGLDIANQTKLAASLNRWKSRGTTPDQIRAMVDLYVIDTGLRNRKAIPWVDFLAKRSLLAAKAAPVDDGIDWDDPYFAPSPSSAEPDPLWG